MKVFHIEKLEEFSRSHPLSRPVIRTWLERIEQNDFKSHAELKKLFPSADYVGNDRYVFNVGGNKFRLVAIVLFVRGRMEVRFIGTHGEYDKLNRSGRIKLI